MPLQTRDFLRDPQTDPTSLYRYRDGIYAADLLSVAIVELDLLTWLTKHPGTFEEICQHFGLAPRPADVLMTLLAANELVTRRGECFETTLLAREHLVGDSPWNVTAYFNSLQDRPVYRDLMRVLRTGRPANWSSAENLRDWHQAMEEDDFARRFTAAMDSRGLLLGRALANVWDAGEHERLLDIAGGSGIYACALTARHRGLKATVFEKWPVDQIAARHIEERGFSACVDVVAGDMFEDAYPANCDVHLLSNVLHDWDVQEVQRLIEKSFRSLPPGGELLVHEAFINESKTGPLPVAEYSAILMHSTQGKCYSTLEMETFVRSAGFTAVTTHPTAVYRSCLTARKPA